MNVTQQAFIFVTLVKGLTDLMAHFKAMHAVLVFHSGLIEDCEAVIC